MAYKPRTSSEINLHRIEVNLKKIKNGTISVQEAALNKRFERLRKDNIGMYEDLYPKYIQIVKNKNALTY